MLTFTDRASTMLKSYLEESEGELTALRITSGDALPGSPAWELALVSDDEWDATDVEVESDGITVLVERDVADLLEGAVVDYVERGGQVGFQVDTRPAADAEAPEGSVPFETASAPQAPPPTEEERIEIPDPPQGPLADRVRELLDQRINPAVSMHGGHIGLADVKDEEIYIVMSGGCQGCALSRMTLKQGVERMIRQELPEVKGVHDVTDHAKGDNPFYEAPIG